MPHGDRATVHVRNPGIDIQVFHVAQGDAGERFVDLPQVDVVLLQAGFLQRFLRRRTRADEHDDGVAGQHGRRNHPCAGGQAEVLAGLLAADQQCTGAVHDARRIARRVHVIDPVNRVVFADDDIVEAILAHLGK